MSEEESRSERMTRLLREATQTLRRQREEEADEAVESSEEPVPPPLTVPESEPVAALEGSGVIDLPAVEAFISSSPTYIYTSVSDPTLRTMRPTLITRDDVEEGPFAEPEWTETPSVSMPRPYAPPTTEGAPELRLRSRAVWSGDDMEPRRRAKKRRKMCKHTEGSMPMHEYQLHNGVMAYVGDACVRCGKFLGRLTPAGILQVTNAKRLGITLPNKPLTHAEVTAIGQKHKLRWVMPPDSDEDG